MIVGVVSCARAREEERLLAGGELQRGVRRERRQRGRGSAEAVKLIRK
jgi:hypothetical protein